MNEGFSQDAPDEAIMEFDSFSTVGDDHEKIDCQWGGPSGCYSLVRVLVGDGHQRLCYQAAYKMPLREPRLRTDFVDPRWISKAQTRFIGIFEPDQGHFWSDYS